MIIIHDSSNPYLRKSLQRYGSEPEHFNSLWPSDAIWCQRSQSTLVQVMVCCLMAPNHYLNQCWHIMSNVQWHPLVKHFIKISHGPKNRSYDNALKWMPQDLTDDKSPQVQVMAWCHQAASHYLSWCWLRSMLPYGNVHCWLKAASFIAIQITIFLVKHLHSSSFVFDHNNPKKGPLCHSKRRHRKYRRPFYEWIHSWKMFSQTLCCFYLCCVGVSLSFFLDFVLNTYYLNHAVQISSPVISHSPYIDWYIVPFWKKG